LVDLGIIQIGAVVVPLYPNISEENYQFIFTDSNVKLVFVEDNQLLEKVNNVKRRIDKDLPVYSFNKIDNVKH